MHTAYFPQSALLRQIIPRLWRAFVRETVGVQTPGSFVPSVFSLASIRVFYRLLLKRGPSGRGAAERATVSCYKHSKERKKRILCSAPGYTHIYTYVYFLDRLDERPLNSRYLLLRTGLSLPSGFNSRVGSKSPHPTHVTPSETLGAFSLLQNAPVHYAPLLNAGQGNRNSRGMKRGTKPLGINFRSGYGTYK